MLKPLGTKHLKLKCDEVLSTFAFNFNLCAYTVDDAVADWGDVQISDMFEDETAAGGGGAEDMVGQCRLTV